MKKYTIKELSEMYFMIHNDMEFNILKTYLVKKGINCDLIHEIVLEDLDQIEVSVYMVPGSVTHWINTGDIGTPRYYAKFGTNKRKNSLTIYDIYSSEELNYFKL